MIDLDDYILCKKCNGKIAYDVFHHTRESLENLFGDPKGRSWTPLLLCPTCIKELESKVADKVGVEQSKSVNNRGENDE